MKQKNSSFAHRLRPCVGQLQPLNEEIQALRLRDEHAPGEKLPVAFDHDLPESREIYSEE